MLNSLAKPKRFASKTMTGDPVYISSAEPKRFAKSKTITVWLSAFAAFVAQRRKNSDGSILELRNCISLRYNFYGGWRNVKILSSGECRKICDCCIFRVNDLEVFL